MYDNSNVPLGADDESAPWNSSNKKTNINFTVCIGLYKDVEIQVEEGETNYIKCFKETSEWEHMKKYFKALGLNIEYLECDC